MNEQSILARLKQFQRLLNLSNEELSEKLNLNSKSLIYYFGGNWIGHSRITYLYKLGINLHWLLTGKWLMHNDSEYGKKLYLALTEDQDYKAIEENEVTNNLANWILVIFGSFQDFCDQTGFPQEELQKIIDSNEISSLKLIKLIEKEGCNIRWLFGLGDDPFKNNDLGRKRRSIILKNKENKSIFSELKRNRSN